MKGFNASIISLGQASTGKTQLLLGHRSTTAVACTSVLDWTLSQAFTRLTDSGQTGRIALSCADVQGNTLVDLLGAHSPPSPPSTQPISKFKQRQQQLQQQHSEGPPVFVEVGSYEEARRLLHSAYAASSNWCSLAPGVQQVLVPQGGRAHTLVRVLLRQGGTESCLSVLDMVSEGSVDLCVNVFCVTFLSTTSDLLPGHSST